MLNPATAISIIEARSSHYALSWKNRGRISQDWKAKLYEQARTGLQLGIYNRSTTVIRLESPVVGIVGVTQLSACPISHAMNVGFSHFKGGGGICVAIESAAALEHLLEHYFAPATTLEIFDGSSEEFERELAEARLRTTAERRQRLARAPVKPRQVTVQKIVFSRNADVVVEVHRRAEGKCESCGSNAPFFKASTGEPYLEVHHIIQLANGGDDTIEKALALCPNCHRQAHYG